MQKANEGLMMLFELCATDMARARELALHIPADKLDCITLFEFHEHGNGNIRNMARELLMHIPADKLDCAMLIEFQKSIDSDIRNMARELLTQNFPEALEGLLAANKQFLEDFFGVTI